MPFVNLTMCVCVCERDRECVCVCVSSRRLWRKGYTERKRKRWANREGVQARIERAKIITIKSEPREQIGSRSVPSIILKRKKGVRAKSHWGERL